MYDLISDHGRGWKVQDIAHMFDDLLAGRSNPHHPDLNTSLPGFKGMGPLLVPQSNDKGPVLEMQACDEL